jgi:hypothetical protein
MVGRHACCRIAPDAMVRLQGHNVSGYMQPVSHHFMLLAVPYIAEEECGVAPECGTLPLSNRTRSSDGITNIS